MWGTAPPRLSAPAGLLAIAPLLGEGVVWPPVSSAGGQVYIFQAGQVQNLLREDRGETTGERRFGATALMLRTFFPLKAILVDTRRLFGKEKANVNMALVLSIFSAPLLHRAAAVPAEELLAGSLPPHTSSFSLGSQAEVTDCGRAAGAVTAGGVPADADERWS